MMHIVTCIVVSFLESPIVPSIFSVISVILGRSVTLWISSSDRAPTNVTLPRLSAGGIEVLSVSVSVESIVLSSGNVDAVLSSGILMASVGEAVLDNVVDSSMVAVRDCSIVVESTTSSNFFMFNQFDHCQFSKLNKKFH